MVILKQLNIERDLIGFFNVSLDEKVHIWTGNSVPNDVNEIRNLLRTYEKQMIVWTIINKQNNEIIGIMRLSHPEIINGVVISGDSQRLLSSYWRKGYMKEARKLVYEFAYLNLKIDILFADVWEGNINSLESLKSVGYKIIEKKEEFFTKENITLNKYYLKLDLHNWYKKMHNLNKDNIYGTK